MKKYLAPIILSLLALYWLLISLRIEIFPIAILILSLSFMPFAKNKVVWAVSAFFLVSLYPLSPIAITYKNAEGMPKLVEHCNIRGPEGMDGAVKQQRKGECIVASDLISGYEPEKFIVW